MYCLLHRTKMIHPLYTLESALHCISVDSPRTIQTHPPSITHDQVAFTSRQDVEAVGGSVLELPLSGLPCSLTVMVLGIT
jgi:hypothetical protein